MTVSSLDQPVRAITQHDLVWGVQSEPLRDIAIRMDTSGCSAVVVDCGNGHFAVVTERDIISAIAAGADPDNEVVATVMSTDVQHISPSTSVADAAELMQLAHIRHLVVSGDDDRLGILSIRDLLEPLLSYVENSDA